MQIFKVLLRIVYGAAFVFAGIMHFVRPEFYLKIMPDYIPASVHAPSVYVSGVVEIVLGALLIVPATSRLAAWGLIALLIAVFPANIYAYQHSQEVFPDIDPALHFWRLPLQAVMIALAYWFTRPNRAAESPPTDAK